MLMITRKGKTTLEGRILAKNTFPLKLVTITLFSSICCKLLNDEGNSNSASRKIKKIAVNRTKKRMPILTKSEMDEIIVAKNERKHIAACNPAR
jgi:hypothetical protein